MSAALVGQSGLAEALAGLAGRAIGIDTEFLRERTFFAQLCLLQISDGEHALCVDALAVEDYGALRSLLVDPATPKIMHAARQDLEVLWPVAGRVHGLYDTQIAAALCGQSAQVGYGELVHTVLGVRLDKAHTRTDWSRRPLSAEQIDYALDDVRYLLPLREALDTRLAKLGRAAWLAEDLRVFDTLDPGPPDPAQAWRRLKYAADLDEARRRVAESLAAWREQRAIQSNRPRGWILPDDALRELVLRVPRDAAQLARIGELPEGIRANSGATLLSLIDALGLPSALPPLRGRQRPDPEVSALLQSLSARVRGAAAELQLAPELLATRRDLESLVAGERAVAPLTGWRRTVIGEQLLAAL